MRAILQRVNFGKVSIQGRQVADIQKGMVILLGIGHGDDQAKATQMVKKIAQLRIFEDDQGKMNLSLLDIQGALRVVARQEQVRRALLQDRQRAFLLHPIPRWAKRSRTPSAGEDPQRDRKMA